MERLKPGQTLGTCKIEAFIAEGGMAMVYKAEQTLMKKKVAVKVLRPEFTQDSSALAGFLKEGMAGARLTHPSIARVYYTAEENGLYYIVMGFVDGVDLRSVVREKGPLPLRKALEIIRQVAEVLAFSHDRGIVHRDIKPGNVMIAKSGEIVLTDFGIASLLSDGGVHRKRKETSGTPSYMSPEQIRGEIVDGRSDLYSLGATLYSLVTGKPPFQATNPQKMARKVLQEAPPRLSQLLPDVPKKVVKLAERLLAKEPAARYQTARDVVLAVDQALTERAPSRLTMPRISSEFLWRKSFWWPVFLSVAALWLFTVILFFAMSWAAPSLPQQGTPLSPWVTNPARGNPTTPPPGGDLEAECPADGALEQRIAQFGRAMLTGRMVLALQLVDEGVRDDPRLINSLVSLKASLKILPARARSTHAIMSRTSSQVYSFILFGDPGTETGIRVHLTWNCTPAGWVIIPERGTNRILFRTRQ
ncbi:MAG: serine/threonine-protein kinase [Planctomycetota bacterium]|nr:serine/threonine-protein kinase [Planctomycetota bacterium]